jgi:ATP-dependent Clp protease ATP-binding subunit ClpC
LQRSLWFKIAQSINFMFERYAVDARRAIFFARHEALQFGAAKIEPGHLLLGLLREPQFRANMLFGLKGHADDFRNRIECECPRSTSHPEGMELELRLSDSNKRVLAYTAMEADELGSRTIDTSHLVLGLLRENEPITTKLLQNAGVTLEMARETIERSMASRSDSVPDRKLMSPVLGITMILLVLLAIYGIVRLIFGR